MKPLHYTQYLSIKINEAISKELDITDDLLTQIQIDLLMSFLRISNHFLQLLFLCIVRMPST